MKKILKLSSLVILSTLSNTLGASATTTQPTTTVNAVEHDPAITVCTCSVFTSRDEIRLRDLSEEIYSLITSFKGDLVKEKNSLEKTKVDGLVNEDDFAKKMDDIKNKELWIDFMEKENLPRIINALKHEKINRNIEAIKKMFEDAVKSGKFSSVQSVQIDASYIWIKKNGNTADITYMLIEHDRSEEEEYMKYFESTKKMRDIKIANEKGDSIKILTLKMQPIIMKFLFEKEEKEKLD